MKITSFLYLKMHKNGGEDREKNLMYVNNCQGLIDQMQHKWTK